jgi:hypothetical protein
MGLGASVDQVTSAKQPVAGRVEADELHRSEQARKVAVYVADDKVTAHCILGVAVDLVLHFFTYAALGS